MQHNSLVPPSHFESDCVDTSPKMQSHSGIGAQPPTGTTRLCKNPVLKTPDDFMVPLPLKEIPSNRAYSTEASPNVVRPKRVSRRSHSATRDSGYEWGRSQSISHEDGGHVNDDVVMMLRELKEENDHLKDALKFKKTEKQDCPNSNFDVITHQVQYIERLQKDISALSSKMHNRDDEIARQDAALKNQQSKLREQNELNIKLKEALRGGNEEKQRSFESVEKLKETLVTMQEQREQISKNHKEALSFLHQKHAEELENVRENANKIREEMEKRFDEERKSWHADKSKSTLSWEEKCQSIILEQKILSDKQLKEVENERSETDQLVQQLQSKIHDSQNVEKKLKEEISELESRMQNMKDSFNTEHDEVERLRHRLDEERDASLKLKTYVSQVQADDLARGHWKAEKDRSNEQVQTLQQEKDELVKTLEILNIRFQSVSKILEMQEESMAAHTKAIPDVQSQNKAAVVTSQWRTKVFELMVQCKSQEITSMEESSKHKIVLKDLTNQLEDQTRECNILSNRVKDVEAQLELKDHKNRTLESSNKQLKEDLEIWKVKLNEQSLSLSQLHDVVSSLSQSYVQSYEENLSKCMEGCLRLEQRLAFANNRLRTVQDLLKRRDTVWRVRLQQMSQKQNLPVPEKKREDPDLTSELLQLTEERDSLSQRLAHDAGSFERTITMMKHNQESCQQVNRELEKRIIGDEEKISDLSNEMMKLRESLDDEKYEKENIEAELKELKKSVQQEVDSAVEGADLQHVEELKEKEASLNQVKRDLTKTVVALRQAERCAVRERTRFTEQLDSERSSWLGEEEKLREDIRQLQRDNNLLLTTLRQEGLISTFKSARGKPATLEDDLPQRHVQFAVSPPTKEPPCKSADKKLTDVDQMLQDLTNLSERVLADSDSD